MVGIKKLIFLFFIYLFIVIMLNVIILLLIVFKAPIVYDLYKEGIIIKSSLLSKAYVFAHGEYICEIYDINSTCLKEYHITYLKGQQMKTIDLLKNLRLQGFDKIWLSQCHTGDSKYVYIDVRNNEKILWDNNVDINNFTGRSYPIFTGFGFVRFRLL